MKATQITSTALCLIIGFICFGTGFGRADEIFFDDFFDRSVTNDVPLAADGVTPVRWSEDSLNPAMLDASSGDLVVSGNGESSPVAFADQFVLGDTSIRTQARITGDGNLTSVGIQARRNSGNFNGYSALIGNLGTLFIFREPGNNQLGSVSTDLDPANEDVILQFDAIGNSLKLWAWRPGESMTEQRLLSVTDGAHTEGQVTVFSVEETGQAAGGVFRYVQVADSHIPEPSTVLMAACAAVGFVAFGRRRIKGT